MPQTESERRPMKSKGYSLLIALAVLLLPLGFSETVAAKTNIVTREDMLNVAKEIHPPGCTDSMTADYCTLSTAHETRTEIYELLKQGNNKDEVIEILVEKYGERILASPTKEGFNLFAWILPGLGIVAGAIVIAFFLRKRLQKKAARETPYSEEMKVSPEMEKKVQEELKNWL